MLARLHSVDFAAVGLGDFGRPDGFLERNLRRWGKQWECNKTRELPVIDELARRLARALPERQAAAIVHGDYRIDNTMVALDDPGRIVAVLDWEMSTLGDPLTDLGLLPRVLGRAAGRGSARVAGRQRRAGIPVERRGNGALRASRAAATSTRSTSTSSSRRTSSRSSSRASTPRYRMGKTLGTGFEDMGPTVDALADAALDVADRSSIRALRG